MTDNDTARDEEEGWYERMLADPPDRLMVIASRDAAGARFEADPRGRECRIWQGYLDASNLLLDHLLRDAPRNAGLIFPAMFTLRHGLEVALKYHIRNEGVAVPRRAGHDLVALSDVLRRAVGEVDEDTAAVIDRLLDLVAEVAAIDPHAVAFRYPTESDGTPIALPPDAVDLRSLCFAVDQLSIGLDHLASWIEMGRPEYRAMLEEMDAAAQCRAE